MSYCNQCDKSVPTNLERHKIFCNRFVGLEHNYSNNNNDNELQSSLPNTPTNTSSFSLHESENCIMTPTFIRNNNDDYDNDDYDFGDGENQDQVQQQ
ncbi:hypothetical protein INT45_001405 [Circinella minor]|uniref:Uncharacterized protein n=1 Tax=Circinella minor TaxID=1195481 RepID=A0A8H7VCD3_9FUNG|nr:hypothetical protein INT45_001405 [Circinella minor]